MRSVRRLCCSGAAASKKIPSLGGVARSAGVGSFPTPRPTPGPDGPFPSQEGIRLPFSFADHTAHPSGVAAPKKIPLGRGGWRGDGGRPRQWLRSQTAQVVASNVLPTPGPDGPFPSQEGSWVPFSFALYSAQRGVAYSNRKRCA